MLLYDLHEGHAFRGEVGGHLEILETAVHSLSVLFYASKCFFDHLDAAAQLDDVSIQVKGALCLIFALLEGADIRVDDVRQVVGLVQVVL